MNVTISIYSLNHIGGFVDDSEDGQQWSFTGVYGFPEDHNKWKTWQLVQQIHMGVQDRWLCVGDFNDILVANEKRGGNARSTGQLLHGRRAMELCGLNDLGFESYPYTWSNGRLSDGNIQCRLDRGLATESFINRFSPIKTLHLPRYGSDHAPLLFELEARSNEYQKKRNHIFRFEEAWSKDERCEDLIKEAWFRSPTHCIRKLQSVSSAR